MKTIAIQGDKLEKLNLNVDTSLYIASQLQNYKIFWYEPHKLSYCNGQFIATGVYIKSHFESNKLEYIKLEEGIIDLSTVSCIMIRQDPPVNMEYIASTHILSLLSQNFPNIFFINNPDAVRNYVEKFLPIITSYTNTPPTLISNDLGEIKLFLSKYQKIIMKPIYDYGGHEIITIAVGEEKFVSEYLDKHPKIQVIIQKFLPEIYKGDKRIIICDGEVLGSLGRIPDQENFLTNTCMGGKIIPSDLTDEEYRTCDFIAKQLKQLGIFFAGIDMIGEFITEVNITSPGLLTSLHKEYGYPEKFFYKLEENIF